MGGNDGNGVGSDTGYEDGTGEGKALGISVVRPEGVDDRDDVELRGGRVVTRRT